MASKNKWDDWDAKDAARTLIRAEEIKNDKRNGFYKAVVGKLDEINKEKQAEALAAKTVSRLHKVFGRKKKG